MEEKVTKKSKFCNIQEYEDELNDEEMELQDEIKE
jgi:hypothetical protein